MTTLRGVKPHDWPDVPDEDEYQTLPDEVPEEVLERPAMTVDLTYTNLNSSRGALKRRPCAVAAPGEQPARASQPQITGQVASG